MHLLRILASCALAIAAIWTAALWGITGLEAIGAGVSITKGRTYSEYAGWFMSLLGIIMIAPPVICCVAIAALWVKIPGKK